MPTPAHQPTEKSRNLVVIMASYGQPQAQIMTCLGITKPTLHKYYKAELARSAIEADRKVLGALYKNAVEGNVIAQIFWAKCRCGWNDKPDEQPFGTLDGKPLHLSVTFRKPAPETIDAVVVPDAG